MHYGYFPIQRQIRVEGFHSIHYTTFEPEDLYPGERHDFCELIVVRRGSCALLTDSTAVNLTERQAILISPNNFHCLWTHNRPLGILVTTFDCRDQALVPLFDRPFAVQGALERRLREYYREAYHLCGDHWIKTRELEKVEEQELALGQSAGNLLELFLIQALREQGAERLPQAERGGSPAGERLAAAVCAYLVENRTRALTLQQIALENAVSKSYLSAIFQSYTGMGVMQYFTQLKIVSARLMAARETQNWTEIAQNLGFSSLHTFSRVFKQVVGVSPAAYRRALEKRL